MKAIWRMQAEGRSYDRTQTFDVVVVGGGPSGATAANDLAREGREVALIDRAGRIKPCGGAIPPKLMRDFDIPEHLMVAQATSARMVAPVGHEIRGHGSIGGFVGMVDREEFDEWLRNRAARRRDPRRQLQEDHARGGRAGDGAFRAEGALNAPESVRARS